MTKTSYKPIEEKISAEPKKSEDIPDNKGLKLIVVHPDHSFEKMEGFLNKKGENTRIYKNTLAFVFADSDSFTELQKNVQEYLVLKEIKSEIQSGERPNLESKRGEQQVFWNG